MKTLFVSRLQDPDARVQNIALDDLRDALLKSRGRLLPACKTLGISRTQYTYWRKLYPVITEIECEVKCELADMRDVDPAPSLFDG